MAKLLIIFGTFFKLDDYLIYGIISNGSDVE